MTRPPVVIVGAGQAGLQLAASLRQAGFDDPITMIGDEPSLPYQRPPLSKAYLGHGDGDRLLLRNAGFFGQHAIDLLLGTAIRAVDRREKTVQIRDGGAVAYSHLVLATGTRARPLALKGRSLGNVLELRTLADAQALRLALATASKAVVIGGGFIGLEFAAVARDNGVEVAVIEAAPRVMGRAVSRQTSECFAERHRINGVDLRFGTTASELVGDGGGNVAAVVLADGERIDADLVLIGAGVIPNQELAADAGLATDGGILVDDRLATGDPFVSAIGDCAAFIHARYARRMRLESVQNATDQAKCLARRLTGTPEPYTALPWFWSDQGTDKLQIAGLTDRADDHVAVRGSDGSLCVHCFENGRYVGLETVNAPAHHMRARKLLAVRADLTKADLERVHYDLRELCGT